MANNLTNTPQPNDILSNSQDNILQNTNYFANTLNKDHQIGPTTASRNDGIANEGYHTVIHFVTQGANPAPVALTGELFTKTVGGFQQLFYQNASGNVLQLTAIPSDVNAAARFATNSSYTISGKTINNAGWVFLSGKIIIQYGSFDPNTFTAVPFPITFDTACFQVQLTGAASNNSTFRNGISTGTISAAGFTWQGTIDSHWTPIYFMAIGI